MYVTAFNEHPLYEYTQGNPGLHYDPSYRIATLPLILGLFLIQMNSETTINISYFKISYFPTLTLDMLINITLHQRVYMKMVHGLPKA